MKSFLLPLLAALFSISSFISCSGQLNEDDEPSIYETPWLIPVNEVYNGGPEKDDIPSIDSPRFSGAVNIPFLEEDDLVLGIKVGDEIRAYPHPILDYHEIVNDQINGLPIAITYCPLTGTGIGWSRVVDGQTTTFGVSGLLYNSNLIPYDRNTDSNWSQILLRSVNGALESERIVTYPLFETTWETWKSMFPNSKVLNTDTGFSRDYGQYPYGDYKTNHDRILFPINPDNDHLPRKERGLGVIIDHTEKFYPLSRFTGQVSVIQDVIDGENIVVVGSEQQNFITAFKRKLSDGTLLEFKEVDDLGNATVMKDNEENRWNIFGEAVSGPRQGAQLEPVVNFMGYWFSWGAFYPFIDIYEE